MVTNMYLWTVYTYIYVYTCVYTYTHVCVYVYTHTRMSIDRDGYEDMI